MADLTGMMQAAAGAAGGGGGTYIEDVFSTWLYTGNGSSQTITNGIDLDGEGGLVWIKDRGSSNDHYLWDTERGALESLKSNLISAEVTEASGLSTFNSNGFSLTGNTAGGNENTVNFVSWTFRKAPKFFDVVTYTGNGANRTISHNLGSVPGCIIVKRTDNTGAWQVYHRANTANPETDYLVLNTTAATADDNTRWNDTLPTDSVFSLGTDATVNANGGTYVAYLFAHDAGGFGDDASENVITCGSLTQASAVDVAVSLGYEPQWLLIKQTDTTGQWNLLDDMRGFLAGSNSTNSRVLRPNLTNAEADLTIQKTSTGFTWPSGQYSSGTQTYVYIAIRRGLMKTPTAGTEVFAPANYVGNGSTTTGQLVTTGFPVDMGFNRYNRGGTGDWDAVDRLRGLTSIGVSPGSLYLNPHSTAAENNGGYIFDATNTSVDNYGFTSSYTQSNYLFRRAPGFFDVVCYTGTGSATTITHNLGVVPELMIVKNRSQADAWQVYAGDATDYLVLNTTAATADNVDRWNDTAPTASVFTIGTAVEVNTSTENYVAYLFASLAGVSKVGSYTGNGTSVSLTTGFQPRFILVKRTDSTGNWIIGDSASGLVAGNDPYILLNSTAAEDTDEDWVDVSATGFTVNETAANANVNAATYIYLAIS